MIEFPKPLYSYIWYVITAAMAPSAWVQTVHSGVGRRQSYTLQSCSLVLKQGL